MNTSPATTLYRSISLRSIESAAANQPLMRRAGLAAADLACALVKDRQGSVLILSGPGNNGGDGFEAGMHLRQRHFDVQLVFAGDAAKLPADAAAARQRFLDAGGCELAAIPHTEGMPWRLIVDALFGIGLQRNLDGHYAELVAAANTLATRHRCPLLALDCPSGLDADTGAVRGSVIHATHTLSFISAKPGLLTAEGPDQCGELHIASLDLDATRLASPDGEVVSRNCFSDWLQPRRRNSHKGSNGNAGILGGAAGMVGAVFLAGRAALQLGAGRVYLGLADPQPAALDTAQPELMLRSASALLDTPLTALACGPGLGTDPARIALLDQAMTLDCPLLLDADALNLLAMEGNLQVALASRNAPSLLTPHPAEAARLLETDVATIQADRIGAAVEISRAFNAHVALKGCGTVIVTPEGHWRINTTGNPGMGSAGMGDVLTGIIVALLAQGWPASAAITAGVHLHGAAADVLATSIGEIGLTASDTVPATRLLLNHWISADD